VYNQETKEGNLKKEEKYGFPTTFFATRKRERNKIISYTNFKSFGHSPLFACKNRI